MAELTSYARGVPCWIDLMSSDPEGARTFYGDLFGWDFEIDDDPETKGYANARLRGKRVAGVGGEPAPQGMPTAWTTYFATADAEGDSKLIADNGGQVLMGPIPIRDQGSFLIATDPTGAVFGLWQAGAHTGSELANEHGSFTWNDLSTRDREGAQRFYQGVFGYDYDDIGSDDMPYAVFNVDGRAVGGIGGMTPGVPEDVPAHWTVTFAVDDSDAIAASATAAGADVVMPAMDTEFGRIVILTDPQGGMFAVMGPVAESAGTT